jgi:hypothetical protein
VIPFHHIAMVLLSLCNGCRGRRRLLSTFERVTGIEPASKHWKCLIITAIRYSRFFEQESRIELPSSAWQADVIATIRLLHLAVHTGVEPAPPRLTVGYLNRLTYGPLFLWGRQDSNLYLWFFRPARTDHLRYYPNFSTP